MLKNLKLPHLKTFIIGLFSFTSIYVNAQSAYWQQLVHYEISGELDDAVHKFTGQQAITYTNYSPDSLKELYFHLYWNAFTKGSHSFAFNGRTSDEPPESYGSILPSSVTVDGTALSINILESIGQVKLKTPIAPGGQVKISMNFVSTVPDCFERAGKNNSAGTDYTFTQWYPKLCRYDKQGWHTDPYFGREFAGTFGTYDVNITLNSAYTVAGTGEAKMKTYLTSGWKSSDKKEKKAKKTTWSFHAERVHDFAWAAEKEWVHKSLMIDGIAFNFFFSNTTASSWEALIEDWPKAYAICKQEFGVYPYSQFSFIQAGEGYMEYPMCTMLEGRASFSTACHEFMHNFFYGIYGSDENLHHWMDEGVTSYATDRLTNITQSATFPAVGAFLSYNYSRLEVEEPIATAANHFQTNQAYYNAAYYKGQLFVEMIRYIIGDNKMRDGFGKYYEQWKFKHPEPNDFVKVFEDVSGMELTWFQNYWLNTVQTIDVSIDAMVNKTKEIDVLFSRKGIPVPVEFDVILKNGDVQHYYIPIDLTNNVKSDFTYPTQVLDVWSCAHKKYQVTLKINSKEVKSIVIDPQRILPDIQPEDNVLSFE